MGGQSNSTACSHNDCRVRCKLGSNTLPLSEEVGCKHNAQVARRHEVVLHMFRTAHSGRQTNNTIIGCSIVHANRYQVLSHIHVHAHFTAMYM